MLPNGKRSELSSGDIFSVNYPKKLFVTAMINPGVRGCRDLDYYKKAFKNILTFNARLEFMAGYDLSIAALKDPLGKDGYANWDAYGSLQVKEAYGAGYDRDKTVDDKCGSSTIPAIQTPLPSTTPYIPSGLSGPLYKRSGVIEVIDYKQYSNYVGVLAGALVLGLSFTIKGALIGGLLSGALTHDWKDALLGAEIGAFADFVTTLTKVKKPGLALIWAGVMGIGYRTYILHQINKYDEGSGCVYKFDARPGSSGGPIWIYNNAESVIIGVINGRSGLYNNIQGTGVTCIKGKHYELIKNKVDK